MEQHMENGMRTGMILPGCDLRVFPGLKMDWELRLASLVFPWHLVACSALRFSGPQK